MNHIFIVQHKACRREIVPPHSVYKQIKYHTNRDLETCQGIYTQREREICCGDNPR